MKTTKTKLLAVRRTAGIIALIAIIGFTMAACGGGDSDSGNGPNGTDDPNHTHNWGAWVETKAALCETAGEETRTCTLDASHTDKRDIPALGHDYRWKVTTLATFDAGGKKQEICTHDASHTRGAQEDIPSVTDAIAAMQAMTGGATPATALDLRISIDLGDMTQADSGWQKLLEAIYGTGVDYINLDLSDCVMSGTEFNPVSMLTGNAQSGKRFIKGLVLPDAAESMSDGVINYAVFRGFSSLYSVSGRGVKNIGNYAFWNSQTTFGSSWLNDIDFQEALTIGDSAFNGCISMSFTEINLPKAETFGTAAFRNCTYLRSINLPKAKNLGMQIFESCTALTSVTLGATPPVLAYSPLLYAGTTTPRTITVHVPAGASGAYTT